MSASTTLAEQRPLTELVHAARTELSEALVKVIPGHSGPPATLTTRSGLRGNGFTSPAPPTTVISQESPSF